MAMEEKNYSLDVALSDAEFYKIPRQSRIIKYDGDNYYWWSKYTYNLTLNFPTAEFYTKWE